MENCLISQICKDFSINSPLWPVFRSVADLSQINQTSLIPPMEMHVVSKEQYKSFAKDRVKNCQK